MDPVIRFCPECGTRAKGTEEFFSNPVQCPNCKSIVLFWNITKEPIGPFVEANTVKPLLPVQAILLIAAVTGVFFMAALALMMTGTVEVFQIITAVFLVFACYAIAIFLGQQVKVSILSEAFKTATKLIGEARKQQLDVAKKYHLLQRNYQSIVDAEMLKIAAAKSDLANRIAHAEASMKEKTETALRNAAESETRSLQIVSSMAEELLGESQKFLIAKLTTQNFSLSRDRFLKTVSFCEKVGYPIPAADVKRFTDRLQIEFEAAVLKQLAKEEQLRIKEKLREEQKVEQEFERETRRAQLEHDLIEKKLVEALSRASSESSAVIDDLRQRLLEVESKQRSISLAQQTKAGNVYVISNIGSFGDSVFKIGMTRRLDPMDRVRELGDASVPFPFDVHMMIGCINAPHLETSLHKRFNERRLNKVNFRKEFFRVSIDEIREAVEELHGRVEYTADPEALQFNESISMTNEEFAVVEQVLGNATEDIDD